MLSDEKRLVDQYIAHRIATDKVLIGILKDIHGNLNRNIEMQEQIINKLLPNAERFMSQLADEGEG